MFETVDAARHPVMSDIAGQGNSVWPYVKLPLRRPWFIAQYLLEFPWGTAAESIMLSDVTQILDLVSQSGPDMKVCSVQLVTPNEPLVGRAGWDIQPLREIWRGVTETDKPVHIFHLDDGRTRVGGFGLPDNEQVKAVERLTVLP